MEIKTKTVLITGGAGYIGGICALKVLEHGFNIIVFDSLETGHIETVNVLKNNGRVLFIKGDLRNKDEIQTVFKNNKIDSVMHFAAFSQVAESMKNPQKYYINNVSGAINLLEAMIKSNVKKIVFSSTAAVYGEPEYIPIDEKHPKNPVNTYGRTKLMIENIMDDYDRSYGVKSVRLRYFNAAGADEKGRLFERHEPETHLIPNILKSAAGSIKTFEMYGDDYDTKDGTCVRDYIDVNDLASAHVLALQYLENGGKTDVFNLGTNEGSTVKEVFAACEEITGKKIPVEIRPRRAGDPAFLIADNSKAEKILGWKPCKTLKDSIKTAYIYSL